MYYLNYDFILSSFLVKHCPGKVGKLHYLSNYGRDEEFQTRRKGGGEEFQTCCEGGRKNLDLSQWGGGAKFFRLLVLDLVLFFNVPETQCFHVFRVFGASLISVKGGKLDAS